MSPFIVATRAQWEALCAAHQALIDETLALAGDEEPRGVEDATDAIAAIMRDIKESNLD